MLVQGLPQSIGGAWPLVIANVLAAPLIEMAPALVRRVGHRGRLILSGIPWSGSRRTSSTRTGGPACAWCVHDAARALDRGRRRSDLVSHVPCRCITRHRVSVTTSRSWIERTQRGWDAACGR